MYGSTIVQFGRISLIFVLYSSLSPFSNRVSLLISNPIETAAKSFELEAIAKSVCNLAGPLVWPSDAITYVPMDSSPILVHIAKAVSLIPPLITSVLR